MRLDALVDFEWLNEPQEVYFFEGGVKITALPKTEFWHSCRQNFHKDNGHLFFRRISGNFSLTIKWCFDDISSLCQCGIMGRIDEFNWFKASIMSEENDNSFIGSSVTQLGSSDLSMQQINDECKEIWYRLEQNDDEMLISYSFDGNTFKQLRMFEILKDYDELLVGAYVCCPRNKRFTAVLSSIEFDDIEQSN